MSIKNHPAYGFIPGSLMWIVGFILAIYIGPNASATPLEVVAYMCGAISALLIGNALGAYHNQKRVIKNLKKQGYLTPEYYEKEEKTNV